MRRTDGHEPLRHESPAVAAVGVAVVVRTQNKDGIIVRVPQMLQEGLILIQDDIKIGNNRFVSRYGAMVLTANRTSSLSTVMVASPAPG